MFCIVLLFAIVKNSAVKIIAIRSFFYFNYDVSLLDVVINKRATSLAKVKTFSRAETLLL